MSKLGWLCILVVAVSGRDDCDRTKCKGPVKFYEDLYCKPVYRNKGDCCAHEYDCSHLRGRKEDKCYANGHEYKVGEKIREEDCFNPCDKQCICYKQKNDVAKFSCPLYNCAWKDSQEGCFIRRKLDSCCGAEQVCPTEPGDRYKCKSDGKTYLDGERFYPVKETNVVCQCGEGYKGKNVAPYCRRTSCGVEYKHPRELRDHCAPILYKPNQFVNPCVFSFRCQNVNDTVIHNNKHSGSGTCRFGNLKLRVGDKLSQSTEPQSSCVDCTCEVPPALTCRQLSDEECIKKYPERRD